MSAVPELLKSAHEAGVRLYLDGEKVRMKAATPPPPELLEQLRQHRDAVLSFLQDGAGNCPGDGTIETPEPPWVDAYAERRAIMVEDGGASEAEAHAQAYQEALQAWFRASPLSAPQEGHCARCGFPVQPSDAGAYWYRDGPDVDPLPVHGKCVQLLQHERRAKAVAALARAGIRET